MCEINTEIISKLYQCFISDLATVRPTPFFTLWSLSLNKRRGRATETACYHSSVIFVNENENENVEKRENNEFVKENENENEKMMKTKTKLKRKNRKRMKTKTKKSKTKTKTKMPI